MDDKIPQRGRVQGHVTVFKNLGPLSNFGTSEARYFEFVIHTDYKVSLYNE